MRRIILGLLLIALSLLLFARAGVLGRRTQLPEPALSPAVSEPAAPSPTPEPTQPPSPTPEPTPEPTPTPRPLRKPILCDFRIDAGFFEPAAERGTLLTDVAYSTPNFVSGAEEPVGKTMQVYLPYGYDENGQYDVLFLIHPRGCDDRFWLEQTHNYAWPELDAPVDAVCMLDNLIERGLARPMLVVSIRGYLDEQAMRVHDSAQIYPQMEKEFAQVILPFVVEHFATYAEGGSREQLSAAREHFGVLGASFGAFMEELSVLAPNLDLVSWYAMTGGGSVTRNYLEPIWKSSGTTGLPISLLYFIEGEFDDMGPIVSSVRDLAAWEGVFKADGNLRFIQINGIGHNETEWVTALYDAAQLFFRE